MTVDPSKPARPSRTIPAELHAAALARLASKNPATGGPYTTREVAAWLLEEHAVTCSHMAVVRLHAAASEKGDALIVAALRDALRDEVAPAAARVRKGSKRVAELLRTEKNTQRAAAGLSALTRALHETAHLGGVAAPVQLDVTSGGKPLPDIHARLGASLARLAEEPVAAGAGAVDPEPPEG